MSDGQATERLEAADPIPPEDRERPVESRPRRSWKSIARASGPYLAAFVVTVWVFRPIIRGRLFGDIVDARWSIAPHEHWYRVWQGREAFRDLFYYFPQPNTLGTSDAFFLQGQIYSLARVLGFGLIDSWVIASAAFFLIGALGVAALGRRLFKGTAFQIAFVVLVCASYPMLTDMLHVQLIGFLVASWIVVGLHNLVCGRQLRSAFAVVCLLPPLLAISSWYPVVLLMLVLPILGLYLLLFGTRPGIIAAWTRTGRHLLTAVRSIPGVLSVIGLVVCWGLVVWVYVPSLHLLPPSTWWEVTVNSPRWSDLINASDGGGGIFSPIYAQVFPPGTANSEQSRGFTPILLAALLVCGLVLLRQAVLRRPPVEREPGLAGRAGLLAMILTVVTTVTLFVVDERGLGLFWVLWNYVPGMESIRAPFRVQTLMYTLAIVVVLRSLELWLGRPRRNNASRVTIGVVSALLVASIFVEMQRPPTANWQPQDILMPELRDQIGQAQQQCDAIFVVGPHVESAEWINSIDAVAFATLSGLSTPQGYSRGQPLANPGLVGDGSSFVDFMRGFGFDGRICRVTPDGVEVVSAGP